MCFGGPKMPNIVYQGPSDADIARNDAQLETYRQQSLDQQKNFESQLQRQIDEANTRAEETRARMEEQRTAALAQQAAQQTAAIAATTTESESEEGAQVTTAIKKKKDPKKSSLKIASGATRQTSGTGLNVGV
tara:strand:+ start:695 stop:1093 length:399 start_codon:yes stop_codon:yes gene_type:complete